MEIRRRLLHQQRGGGRNQSQRDDPRRMDEPDSERRVWNRDRHHADLRRFDADRRDHGQLHRRCTQQHCANAGHAFSSGGESLQQFDASKRVLGAGHLERRVRAVWRDHLPRADHGQRRDRRHLFPDHGRSENGGQYHVHRAGVGLKGPDGQQDRFNLRYRLRRAPDHRHDGISLRRLRYSPQKRHLCQLQGKLGDLHAHGSDGDADHWLQALQWHMVAGHGIHRSAGQREHPYHWRRNA